jgi:DtxR family Mn-dependent transcriptional regulator
MPDPVTTLTVSIFIIFLLVFIFWPEKGLWARWRWSNDTGKRVLMEDALKHIYNCEQENVTCTHQSLAGVLSQSTDKVAVVLERLESLGLLILSGRGFELTAAGKSYALRVIRVHRLWERFLSEETGVPETAWHEEAEKKEHQFTEEQIDAISRRLGYPRYDPHGDPIPTASGDLPPTTGKPLTEFEEGQRVEVVQIEDEPPAIYAEIVKKGIHLQAQFEILKKSNTRMHILNAGNVLTLKVLSARNIFVTIAKEKQQIEEPFVSLSSLKMGEKAEVVGISRACRGTQRRRLMDLGIVPGTLISTEMVSAGGDPKAYNIRGAIIALRDDQAGFVHIQMQKKAG